MQGAVQRSRMLDGAFDPVRTAARGEALAGLAYSASVLARYAELKG